MPGYQPRHNTDPVWFNGQQVNTLTVASAQTGVRITAVYGWDERPDVRDVRELRSGQDGEYADNLYLGGRTITIEGEVYGSTWVNLQSRKRALAALFNPSSTEALLKIPDPATASPTAVYATTGMTGYERVSARVTEAIQFGDTLDPCCQVFQVVLRASDPRIYSDTASTTTSITTGTAARTATVDQGGTYPTPSTITVTGPTASDFAISTSDDSMAVALDGLTLSAAESISIDSRDRTMVVTSTFDAIRNRHPNLIAGWLLAETVGSTADNYEGTAALDLTYSGGFTLNQTGPGTGLKGVDLNGTTGYITSAAAAAFSCASFSIEMWASADGSVSDALAFGYSGGTTYWGISMGAGDYLSFVVDNSTTDAQSRSATGSFSSASGWTHIVATYDNSTRIARIYVNGLLSVGTLQTVGVGGFTPGATPNIRLGANAAAGVPFDGKLGAAAFYNTSLSATQVADLYAAATTLSGVTENGYMYSIASASRWSHLPTTSVTFTLDSSGLNTGSSIAASYRDARL